MKRLRPLAELLLWHSFRAILAIPAMMTRHWRRMLATTTMAIAAVRAVIWIAKALASAGTVDTALNLIGLGEYVRPFEDAVDSVVATVISVVLTVTPTG